MSDPTKNTFQNQSSIYLGLETPTASGSLATTAQDFVIGYQGTEYAGYTSRGFEFVATQPNLAIMDVHANDGSTGNNYDYRIIWGAAGATAQGEASMNCQGAEATFYHPLRTNPVGAALPPSWFLDYGEVVVADGTNQVTTISFNTTFPSAPKVIVQVVDDGPGVQVDNFTTYIEATTTTSCSVRGFGSVSTGFKYNWIAIGGV